MPEERLNYEVGDFIQITPTDSKDVLKITGNIQGDVDKQKEDYSDGIDNYDYIGNVRFQVEEDHLKTVYNEAKIFAQILNNTAVFTPKIPDAIYNAPNVL